MLFVSSNMHFFPVQKIGENEFLERKYIYIYILRINFYMKFSIFRSSEINSLKIFTQMCLVHLLVTCLSNDMVGTWAQLRIQKLQVWNFSRCPK